MDDTHGRALRPTGRTKRTALWNFYEVKCPRCGLLQWVPAGVGRIQCVDCSENAIEAAEAAKGE